MRYEIFINGQPVDYDSTVPLVLKLESSALNEPSKRGGAVSYQFSLPLTRNNKQVLGLLFEPRLDSLFYTDLGFRCDVYSDGNLLLNNATLYITELTDLEVQCFLLARSINWVERFRRLSLRDLEFKKIAFTGMDSVGSAQSVIRVKLRMSGRTVIFWLATFGILTLLVLSMVFTVACLQRKRS
jgi:hypothetical protein